MIFTRTLTLVAVCLTAACGERFPIPAAEAAAAGSNTAADVERARHDSSVRAGPGYVIDSIRPIDEDVRRFQSTLGPRPTGFNGGAISRDALVRAFVRAVESRDTTALAKLVVDRAEFGYLVYPTSPNARPPYRQSPEIVWLMRSAATGKARSRLIERFGGQSLGFAGLSCSAPPKRQGDNTIWSDCAADRVTPSGNTTRVRIFGAIVERDGRFKFLSLAGGL
jgi:hypothetical protein